MRDELYQVLSAIKYDNEIRSVVLKGAGERAFCAGADLSEFLTAPSPTIARQVRWDGIRRDTVSHRNDHQDRRSNRRSSSATHQRSRIEDHFKTSNE